MTREGYKIFDADTHIIEPVEPIEAYLPSTARARLEALGPLVQRTPSKGGVSRYLVGNRPALNRRLGSREKVSPPAASTQAIKGVPWNVRWQGPPFPNERLDFDPHARVQDMDVEGIDVNVVLPSGGIPAFCSLNDVAVELAMYEAFHRFIGDYCASFPDRLKSVILVSGRDVAGSVTEVHRCGKEPWPVGIFPICPEGRTLDDPEWEPLWAVAESYDLTVVIHSFTMASPYPPGIWDNWDNLFLQRASGHVWNAQRNMAALLGAGVLDRYPGLRIAPLECGHGWLACWGARLDEAADMCRHLVQPLKRKPSEYIRGPQYFQSIQLHEGEQSLRHAIEAVGEETLMFATDYPHTESWFPKSVEAVLGWTSISETARKRLFWDNALRCYQRAS